MSKRLEPARLPFYTVRAAYDTDVEYAGWATPGTAATAAEWSISKTTYSAGKLVSVLWADGNALPDNIWNNYASLTYA